VVSAVHSLAQRSSAERCYPKYELPSLAVKVGNYLTACAGIVTGKALRTRDADLEKTVSNFVNLYCLEWNRNVSSHAQQTMRQMMDQCVRRLEREPTKAHWSSLAEQTLAKVTTFNKRRGGEAARILLCEFTDWPAWHENCMSEFQATLSPMEKELCARLELILVVGKQRRPVPILLTPDVSSAISLLGGE